MVRPLQYNSLFLITHPPPLDPTSLFNVYGTRSQTIYLKSRGKLCVCYLLHTMFLVVYWVSGPVRFTLVRRSACWAKWWCSWVQPYCTGSLRFMRFTQMQCRKCCFDVYKLLMNNDIDRPPASLSIYCGDENQWIILEWPKWTGPWDFIPASSILLHYSPFSQEPYPVQNHFNVYNYIQYGMAVRVTSIHHM